MATLSIWGTSDTVEWPDFEGAAVFAETCAADEVYERAALFMAEDAIVVLLVGYRVGERDSGYRTIEPLAVYLDTLREAGADHADLLKAHTKHARAGVHADDEETIKSILAAARA
jgi:hypothetical protein